MVKKRYFLVALLFINLACSSNLTYKPGLFLSQIYGKFSYDNQSQDSSDSFVLIIAYQNTGLSLIEGQAVFQKRAFLIYPNSSKEYSFASVGKGEKFDFYYFASNSISQTKSFSQTLGVSKIEANINFITDNDWKNSYVFFVRPFLSEILAEPRYQLAAKDILFLSQWLEKIENSIL